VAGAVPKAQVLAAVGRARKGLATQTVTLRPGHRPAGTRGGVYFVDFPGAKQSVVYVGRLALAATDPNSNNLDFANEVLGGGSSGKLFQTLRIEKGYTYGAYSFVSQLKAQARLR
jgi:zinc protease